MRLFLLFTLSLIVGCSSNVTPVSYYQLQSSIKETTFSEHRADLIIAPIMMSGHLNGCGIAMQVDDVKIVNANFHLWSGILSEQLLNTALIHQQNNLDTFRILPHQQETGLAYRASSYELRLRIRSFQGDNQGNAHISGMWMLYHKSKKGLVLMDSSRFTKQAPLGDSGYSALVKALSSLWQDVNKDISQRISQFELS